METNFLNALFLFPLLNHQRQWKVCKNNSLVKNDDFK